MYPKELVGKKAIRTESLDLYYYTDKSFINEPIYIVNAGDSSLVYKWVNGGNDREIKLDSKWIDNNWQEYQE